jgi:hypothetical protein
LLAAAPYLPDLLNKGVDVVLMLHRAAIFAGMMQCLRRPSISPVKERTCRLDTRLLTLAMPAYVSKRFERFLTVFPRRLLKLDCRIILRSRRLSSWVPGPPWLKLHHLNSV